MGRGVRQRLPVRALQDRALPGGAGGGGGSSGQRRPRPGSGSRLPVHLQRRPIHVVITFINQLERWKNTSHDARFTLCAEILRAKAHIFETPRIVVWSVWDEHQFLASHAGVNSSFFECKITEKFKGSGV